MEEALFRCSSKTCRFATTEPYNYCPFCGSFLWVSVDGSPGFPIRHLSDLDSNCPNAYKCSLIDNYRGDCESMELSVRCFTGLFSAVEGLQAEIRRLQRAFQDAGIRVSPQQDTDLQDRLDRERCNSRRQTE